jgi:hypothetical protein
VNATADRSVADDVAGECHHAENVDGSLYRRCHRARPWAPAISIPRSRSPANGKAVFTIVANVGASATGDLVSSATVAAASGETNTANNTATDTDRFVPKSIAVADDAGWSSTSRGAAGESRPRGGRSIDAQAFAFEPDFKTGVRTVPSAISTLNGKDGTGRRSQLWPRRPTRGLPAERRFGRHGDARQGRPLQPAALRVRQYDRGLNVVVG